ncbi:MAG TPA: hypothetical protein VKK31_05050 [Thermoanaerobaculia bacterium]|nr:hypothetical protein [Thermoanaerobaculia bacterium]
MNKKVDISKEKKPRGKNRSSKQSAPVKAVDGDDEVQLELRKWFEENRSLHPLALYAKFHSGF